ncbi:hypothetical protein Tco_0797648 [Tanacetum coccineum]
MGDIIAQTRFENVSKLSNYLLLVRGNKLRSGEGSLKLKELVELCTNLQQRVLDLEKAKTTQAEEIFSLKRRLRNLGDDVSKQGRINAIDVDEDITLVNDQDDADMFDVNTLTGDEVLAEQEVAAKDVNLTVDEVTLAQALAALKSVKPKVKANIIEEPSVPVSADIDEEENLQGKGRNHVVLIEEWDVIQAKIEAGFLIWLKTASRGARRVVFIDLVGAKIKELMEIVHDEEEVAIDVIPLAVKPPTIGRIVGIKSFLMLFGITAVLNDVYAAQSKLVLLENFNENYSNYLRLLYKVNATEGVSAASKEVSTAELVSTAYVISKQQYNLAYFFVKRIESARATPKAHLPYACHSVSSTSAHHNRGSSSHQGDDDEDDGASRASTPSPTTYLNSLGPLDYHMTFPLLLNKMMIFSLNVKLTCSIKHNKCIRNLEVDSSHLARH